MLKVKKSVDVILSGSILTTDMKSPPPNITGKVFILAKNAKIKVIKKGESKIEHFDDSVDKTELYISCNHCKNELYIKFNDSNIPIAFIYICPECSHSSCVSSISLL